MNEKKFFLNPKIIIPFIVLILINIAIATVFHFYTKKTQELYYNQAFTTIEFVNNFKHHILGLFFYYRKMDIKILAHNETIIDLSKNLLTKNVENDPYIDAFLKEYIYSDVLLIDKNNGHIMFSAKNKKFISKDITSDKFNDSAIKKLFYDVLRTKKTLASDMHNSCLSNNEPSIILATPVMKDNKIISILMLPIPNRAISEVMHSREGMGESGESYIVGTDNLLRSDIHLRKNFNVKNSFKEPEKYSLHSVAIKEALSGNSSHAIIKDYRGINVLSTYRPFDEDSIRWAVISEIDESELQTSYTKIKYEITIISIIISMIMTIIAYLVIMKTLAVSVVNPLKNSYKNAKSFEDIINNSLNEIYIFDKDTLKFNYVNRGAVLNCGYKFEEFINMTPLDIEPTLNRKQFNKLLQPLLQNKKEQVIFDSKHERKDGTVYDVEIRLQLMNVNNKETFVKFVNDTTQRNEALKDKEEYYIKATHDHLTKIYNRQMFDEIYKSAYKSFIRYKKPLSLILFDIDDFKKVNDTYGHDAGDKVLIELVKIVSTCVRDSDVFARWGGEEFVVLMKETDINQAYDKAEDIRKKIQDHTIDVEIGKITCSFGVATLSGASKQEDIFKCADEALYKAKDSGKNIVIKGNS